MTVTSRRTWSRAWARGVPCAIALALASLLLAGCTAGTASTGTDDIGAMPTTTSPPTSGDVTTESVATQKPTPPSKPATRPPAKKPAASPKPTRLPRGFVRATVVSVTDGDTVRVRLPNGRIERLRLIGIDTPESTRQIEPYGKQASAFTERELDGRAVYLEYDAELRDRYERMLAYVWLTPPSRLDGDGRAPERDVRAKMFNARLALRGYAGQMTVPPNVRYADYFRRYVSEARSAERGLWGLDLDVVPVPHPDGSTSRSGSGSGGGSGGSSGAVYVGSRRSDKFHEPDCYWAGKIASYNLVTFSSRQDAIARGYVPCKVCDP